MRERNPFLINTLIVIVGSLLFIPLLGKVHLFDWDEANFAESAREMIVSGNYFNVQVNFEIFWEKPPLFMWLQTLSMHMFGVNEFAARFPNAIAGIATLLVLFNIGRKEFDEKFGLFWIMVYAGSILPHFYFKSGIIDPIFNLFIFLGIYNLAKVTDIEKGKSSVRLRKAMWAGVFIGLAVLTKGPVAFLITWICIACYFIVKRSMKVISFKELFLFTVMVGVLSFAWFGIGMIKDGPYFIVRFIQYQIKLFSTEDAGHGGPFFYHFLILLIGCFPSSIYVFKSFIRQYSDTYEQRNLKIWMMISLVVVLVLFSIVKTKIVHYSSFCYFPISFLAAYTLHKVLHHRAYFSRMFHLWFLFIGGLLSIALILIPVFMKFRFDFLERMKPYVKDEFALEMLKIPVEWTGLEISVGCFYFLAILLSTYYHYKKPLNGAIIMFVSTLITVQFTMYLIVPKVEEHVQGPVIKFYQSVKDENVYVESVGFKSYADLFYANVKPGNRVTKQLNLLEGPTDKPIYIVRKINRNKEVEENPALEKIGAEGGFVFYKREITK